MRRSTAFTSTAPAAARPRPPRAHRRVARTPSKPVPRPRGEVIPSGRHAGHTGRLQRRVGGEREGTPGGHGGQRVAVTRRGQELRVHPLASQCVHEQVELRRPAAARRGRAGQAGQRAQRLPAARRRVVGGHQQRTRDLPDRQAGPATAGSPQTFQSTRTVSGIRATRPRSTIAAAISDFEASTMTSAPARNTSRADGRPPPLGGTNGPFPSQPPSKAASTAPEKPFALIIHCRWTGQSFFFSSSSMISASTTSSSACFAWSSPLVSAAACCWWP